MTRLRYNNQNGTLGAALTSSGTTITFTSAPDFATITSPDYIPISLDVGTTTYEIVYLTAYTAGATTGTITRAAEASSLWPAVAHNSGSGTWCVAATTLDFPQAAVNRTVSGTMGVGEVTFFTGATGQTLTLPSAPSAGTPASVTNSSANAVTIARGGSDLITHYQTTGLSQIVIAPNMEISFTYIGSVWFVTDGGFIPGQMLARTTYATGATYPATGGFTTTLTAIDSTNLTFTPIVPPNGILMLELTVNYVIIGPTTAANPFAMYTGWLQHGTSTLVGALFEAFYGKSVVANDVFSSAFTTRTVATGLTPGALALDAAAVIAVAQTGAQANIYTGPGTSAASEAPGPALLVAYASA
jgi:hypothetical protein